MPKTDTSIFMMSKSSKITPIDNVAPDISSKIPPTTSAAGNTPHFWLTVVLALVAVAGVVGTVGIAVVSFAVPHSTTTTSKLKQRDVL